MYWSDRIYIHAHVHALVPTFMLSCLRSFMPMFMLLLRLMALPVLTWQGAWVEPNQQKLTQVRQESGVGRNPRRKV